MDKKKLRRAPLFVAAAAVLPIALGACSSSSSSSNTPAAAAGNSSTQQAGAAQFAQCMRQNGVTNFPDPQNGRFLMNSAVQSNPNFHSAIQTCQHFLGSSGLGGGTSAGGAGPNSSAMLAFAHCMQTHGEPKFPDPSSGGALNASGMDPNSPTFQKAFNQCKSNLPGNGAGLGG